ncbi:MAG: hypothetical protein ABIP20_02300 [Chthoniobacteraceae bacterium]
MPRTIRKQSASVKAFTLIELPVVIGNIAVLAGIALAVSGTGIGHYTGDHEGVLPGPL